MNCSVNWRKRPMANAAPPQIYSSKIERVGQLPRSKQKFVIDMIETVIQQAAY